jgi:hypothetical protein
VFGGNWLIADIGMDCRQDSDGSNRRSLLIKLKFRTCDGNSLSITSCSG